MVQVSSYPMILLGFAVLVVSGEPLFHHGRPRGGMIGIPNVDIAKEKLPKADWFTQKLDHFNNADTRTWSQRYFVNSTFHHGQYVFLMIGGEGPANPVWMTTGTWITFAEKMGALCLMVEHRYYGESHPTKDLSTPNLRYLSSEQALADLAMFITNMRETMSLIGHKWVAFGGSYSGSLAAWLRLKYPHLVDAAVATSAPVQAQMNFKGYLDVTTESLETSESGSKCTSAIREATTTLEAALKNATQWKTLEEQFKLCKPLNLSNKNDVSQLASTLAGNFEGVVQYNRDNRAFEGAVGTNITISTLCGMMTNTKTGPAIKRYADVNTLILKTYGEKCLDSSYGNMIHDYRETSWSSATAVGGRQWLYQTCTEFGFYQTSDSKNQPFGSLFPLEFSLQQCADIYGSAFTEHLLEVGIRSTNMIYGGFNITATKVVYPNGKIDQWHYLGVTKNSTENPLQVALFIEGTAHCADMYPGSPMDPPQLTAARESIFSLLKQWLQ